jgi:transposase
MPQERLSMRKISEVLRLKWASHLSNRGIARSCQLSHSTVSEYLKRAEQAGISWPIPEGMTEDELYLRLFPEKAQPVNPVAKPMPDWEYVRKELKKRNVTLRLLWDEYQKVHPDGYGYSQWCELYRHYVQKLDPPMRQNHKAGEKLFVDYAGDTIPITNPETGEISQAAIFVAVQGASSYTYAEAQANQTLPNWIGGHVRAHAFFGGVTALIVPDNLKQGVKSPCWYDPDLNQTYQEWAAYYQVAVIPARVKRPRDKAVVEVGVQVVERWILAALRNRTFFSLAELNREMRILLAEINQKKMVHLEKSRRELFEELDQPALHSLPERPYEYTEWKNARVNIDYHVEYDKHYYSVPYILIHEEVRIRASEHMIAICHKSQSEPVALHPRSHAAGRYTTLTEHMPVNHQKAGEWTPERIRHWASEIGPQTVLLVEAILSSRQHPEQGFRACLGILRLSGKYDPAQMEAACQLAREAQLLSYRDLKLVLETMPALPTPVPPALPAHENIRGTTYYQ